MKMGALWIAALASLVLTVAVAGRDLPLQSHSRALQGDPPPAPFCFQNKQPCTAFSFYNPKNQSYLETPVQFSTCEFRGAIWVSPTLSGDPFGDVQVAEPADLAQAWVDQYTSLKTKDGYVVGKATYTFSQDNKNLDARYLLFCNDFDNPGVTFPESADSCTAPVGGDPSIKYYKCWRVDTSATSTPARGAYYSSTIAAVAGVTLSACGADLPLLKQLNLETTKEFRGIYPARDVCSMSTPLKDVAGLWGGSTDQPLLINANKAILYPAARVNVVPMCVAFDESNPEAPAVEKPIGPRTVAWLSHETRTFGSKCYAGWGAVTVLNGNNYDHSNPDAIEPCPRSNIPSTFFASTLCVPTYKSAKSMTTTGASCY